MWNPDEHKMKQLNDDALAHGISVQSAFPEATGKRHNPTLVSSLSHLHFQEQNRNVKSRRIRDEAAQRQYLDLCHLSTVRLS